MEYTQVWGEEKKGILEARKDRDAERELRRKSSLLRDGEDFTGGPVYGPLTEVQSLKLDLAESADIQHVQRPAAPVAAIDAHSAWTLQHRGFDCRKRLYNTEEREDDFSCSKPCRDRYRKKENLKAENHRHGCHRRRPTLATVIDRAITFRQGRTFFRRAGHQCFANNLSTVAQLVLVSVLSP